MLGAKLLSVAPVRVCTPFDFALDRSTDEAKEKLVRYAHIRDESIIDGLEISGERVMWFYVKRLPRSVVLDIDATAPNDKYRWIHAFRLSVVKVDGLRHDDGTIEDGWRPDYLNGGDGDSKKGLSKEELNFFNLEEVYDIGAFALKRASFRPGKLPYSEPPESSVRALGEAQMTAAFTRADANRLAASQRSEDSEATSTATPTKQDFTGSDGALGTDATATDPRSA